MLQPVYKDKAGTLVTNDGTAYEQLCKDINSFKELLRYYGKKNGWQGKIIMCVSDNKSGFAFKCQKKTSGRFKTYFHEPKQLKGFCKVEPHVHFVIENAYPNTIITSAITKYWKRKHSNGKAHFSNIREDKGGVSGFIGYMKDQSNYFRTVNLG